MYNALKMNFVIFMWCTNSVQVELLCGLWNYKSFIGVLLTIQLMINALQIVDGVEVAKKKVMHL